MKPESGFADLSSGRLYYEAAGAGQAVLFIHGFGLDTRMWDDQFEAFARQYRAIRFDLRGFGKSPPPAGVYSRVEDIRALLGYLEADRPHLVGLSLGGGIALDVAVTYPAWPRSLVLVDSALGGFPWKTDFNVRAKEIGVEAAKRRWLAHPLFVPANESAQVAARLAQMVSQYSGWHWLNHDPGLVPDPLPVHRLESITAPALIVVGERDLPDFLSVASLLEREVRGARKAVLPGAGHMSNMEAPEAFNEVVLGFLKGL
jgi:pimeloyl-ACP methyl ester carboxylesterase